MPGADPEGVHCRGRCLHRPGGLALPRGLRADDEHRPLQRKLYDRNQPGAWAPPWGAGGINPAPTNGFYARREPGCAHKQNEAGAFQDGRRRSFLYIQLFRTRPRKFARGRASSHEAAQVRTGPRKFVQGCASKHHRAGACGQRRNRRPVSSASTVRVSPGAWLPAMISLAIIVSTWAWI